jgi:ABC-type multidrug transport system fused ATPase/permease subunit
LVPFDYPKKGDIHFTGVHMQYRPNTPKVLNGLTISILNKQKIGIVGRTGAGKSSIIQTIFRMVEI